MCLGEGSGEGVDVTLVSNKIRYISLVDLSRVGFMFVVTIKKHPSLFSHSRPFFCFFEDSCGECTSSLPSFSPFGFFASQQEIGCVRYDGREYDQKEAHDSPKSSAHMGMKVSQDLEKHSKVFTRAGLVRKSYFGLLACGQSALCSFLRDVDNYNTYRIAAMTMSIRGTFVLAWAF